MESNLSAIDRYKYDGGVQKKGFDALTGQFQIVK